MPYQEPLGIAGGDPVSREDGPLSIQVGQALIGRVINTWGIAIDNKPPLSLSERRSVYPQSINPLERALISQQLVSGIRAIDAFVPIGCGQRLGIFSGSGVGKSVLMGMMTRNTTAEVNVIALIGERSREVREFIDNELGAEGLQRSVLVVSTSELPPLARLRAAHTALTVAEYFRDCGHQVLLFFDSVTRFAMAQREIGLSIGEPPTTRGYPPSVFSLLPQILERCGATEQGSITGIFSVLVEGDDLEEPISDALQGLLDGHIILSRRQAQRNFYPAIDILRSISRLERAVCSAEMVAAAAKIRSRLARYQDSEELIQVGAYESGSNPLLDKIIKEMPAIELFLQQGIDEKASLVDTQRHLLKLAAEKDHQRAA